jgi:hypothetical protein
MIKNLYLQVCFLLIPYLGISQHDAGVNNYKNGYALKGADTLWCKIQFDTKYSDARKSIELIIDSAKLNFTAGGLITGFGFEEAGSRYDYGSINVEMSILNRRIESWFFTKKLAAGAIDFYEYNYTVHTTKTTTVNGEVRGQPSSSSERGTNYYIAKNNTDSADLMKPAYFPTFRKKDFESYLNDNADLFATIEKKLNLKELIKVLKEYNQWYLNYKRH